MCVLQREMEGNRNRERKREGEGEGFEHFFAHRWKQKKMSYFKGRKGSSEARAYLYKELTSYSVIDCVYE